MPMPCPGACISFAPANPRHASFTATMSPRLSSRGCLAGSSAAAATNKDAKATAKVTQIAFPEAINGVVYASGVYAPRGSNPIANQSDGIFADSLASELITPAGDPTNGYAANCQVAIAL